MDLDYSFLENLAFFSFLKKKEYYRALCNISTKLSRWLDLFRKLSIKVRVDINEQININIVEFSCCHWLHVTGISLPSHKWNPCQTSSFRNLILIPVLKAHNLFHDHWITHKQRYWYFFSEKSNIWQWQAGPAVLPTCAALRCSLCKTTRTHYFTVSLNVKHSHTTKKHLSHILSQQIHLILCLSNFNFLM